MHHKIDLNRLQEFFQHVTALEALEILCNIFEAPNSQAFVDGLYFSLKDLLTLPKYWANISADELDIQFYGGPPGKGRHFNGTLLTMLLDHAAFQLAKGKFHIVGQALSKVKATCK